MKETVSITLDKDLLEVLRRRAEQSKRSLSGYINYILSRVELGDFSPSRGRES